MQIGLSNKWNIETYYLRDSIKFCSDTAQIMIN